MNGKRIVVIGAGAQELRSRSRKHYAEHLTTASLDQRTRNWDIIGYRKHF